MLSTLTLLFFLRITLFSQVSLPDATLGIPGKITSASDLIWLSQNSAYWGDDWEQTDDITFASDPTTVDWDGNGNVGNSNDALGFPTIGNSTTKYTGNYSGNGFKIENLYINRPTRSYVGLFGCTKNATIKEVELRNVDITGLRYVGGLVGSFQHQTISNCFISGRVESKLTASPVSDFSGLIAGNTSTATIINCGAKGVVATQTGAYCSGGITGQNYISTIQNCYVSATTNDAPLIGHSHHSHSSYNFDLYYNDDVFSSGYTPNGIGLTSIQLGSSSNFSNWDFQDTWEIATISAIAPDPRPYLKHQIYPHRLDVRSNITLSAEALIAPLYMDANSGTTVTAKTASGYTFVKWEDEAGNTLSNAPSYSVPNGFFSNGDRTITAVYTANLILDGLGTPTAPFLIKSLDDLMFLSNSPDIWDKHFKLNNDIDCGANANTIDWNGNGTTGDIEDALGFQPIALGNASNGRGNFFSGTFDGNNKTIRHLYINRPNDKAIGLFSNTKSATISHLTLEACSIKGNNYVGGLVGNMISISSVTPTVIEHCTVSSSLVEGVIVNTGGLIGYGSGTGIRISDSNVENTNVKSSSKVGGIAGSFLNGKIERCKVNSSINSSAKIECSSLYNGGIVGMMRDGASVTSTHTDITIDGGSYVGGIAGLIYNGSIKESYTTGNVSGTSAIGGIVGMSDHSYDVISACFSSSAISGTSNYFGGICGVSEADILNCYTTGAVNGTTYAGGLVGKIVSNNNTTAIAKVKNSYSAASVIGTSNSGAVFGGDDITKGSDIEHIYYHTEASAMQNNAIGNVDDANESAEIHALATADFENSGSFSGFTFGTTESAPWETNSNGAPLLYWQQNNQMPIIYNENDVSNNDGTASVTATVNTNGTTISKVGVRWRKSTETAWQYATGNLSNNTLTASTGAIKTTGYSYIQTYIEDANNNYYYGTILLQNMKYSGGAGTLTSPYLIVTPQDLIELSNTSTDWGAHFRQISDIDFGTDHTQHDWDNDGTIGSTDDALGFNPIGTSTGSNFFTGTYRGYKSDGAGTEQHNISHMYINRPSQDYIGLFGALSGSSTAVAHLTLLNTTLTGKSYVAPLSGIASSSVSVSGCKTEYTDITAVNFGSALIGRTYEKITITNCEAKEAIVSVSANYSGGLTSRIDNGCQITNCQVKNITVSCGALYCGGISGYAIGANTISDCTVHNFETNDTNPAGANGYLGGISGFGSDVTITNCNVSADTDFAGTIAGRYDVGGILGVMTNGGTVNNSTVDGISLASAYTDNVGGLIGLVAKTSVPSNILDCSVNNVSISGKRNYTGGAIGYGDGKHFVKRCEVTNSNISTQGGYCGGFIGKCLNGFFLENNLVKNTSTEGTASYVGGFIGCQTNSSNYYNKTEGGSVIGHSNYTGGFIGINDASSTLEHCAAEDINVQGVGYTGGFAGRNLLSKIVTSYATGNASSTSTYLGGFIGYNHSASISECYSTVNVNGTGNSYLGGFVGLCAGNAILKDCYATGKVNGGLTTSSSIAGFAASFNNTFPIENCYYAKDGGHSVLAVGTIIEPYIAHIISTDAPINGYYANNTIVDGSENPVTTGSGTPLRPEDMENQSSFAGFDFVNVWGMSTIPDISNSPRPYLKMQLKDFQISTISNSTNGGEVSGTGYYNSDESVTLSATPHSGYLFSHFEIDNSPVTTVGSGDDYTFICTGNAVIDVVYQLEIPFLGAGTESSPYLIHNFEELRLLSQMNDLWDKDFKLANDINCLKEGSSTVADFSLVDWNNDGNPDGTNTLGFSPIGTQANPFSGTFLSSTPHTISNLYINRTSQYYNALFGYTKGTTADSVSIANIALTNAVIKGSSYSAGLVGYSYAASVDGCSIVGEIEGRGNTAGLIGYAVYSNIRNSHSNVKVTSSSQDAYTGGFIGRVSSTTITNCESAGSIVSLGYQCGGFAGEIAGPRLISYCKSSTIIEAISEAHVGGFAGLINTNAIINNCSAQGDIRGASYTGGFVGSHYGGAIQSCFTTSNVYASSRTGGFVGFIQASASIKDSYSTGAVRGNNKSGGFVGHAQNSATIENVYSAGTTLDIAQGAWGGEISSVGTFSQLIYDNDFTKFATTAITDDLVGMSSNVTALTSDAFKLPTAFTAFPQGSTIDAPWQLNAQGRPYLYWQSSEIIVDNSIFTGTQNTGYQCATSILALGEVSIVEQGVCICPKDGAALPTSNTYTYIASPLSNGQVQLPSSATHLGTNYYVRVYAKGSNGKIYYGETAYLQANDFDGGDGTGVNPYQIRTLDQLRLLSENSEFWDDNLYFIQTADIDATPTSGWDTGLGFLPIGRGTGSPTGVSGAFYGQYDGRGHSISHLTINRPDEPYCGLFGLTSTARIFDLELNDVTVAGKSRTGGIVGYLYNSSILENCSTDGDVSSLTNHKNAGIAVGYTYNSKIYNCRASGNISSYNSYEGGLLGRHQRSQVYNAYAVTNGTGAGNALVGYAYPSTSAEYATVEDSYFDNNNGASNDIAGITGLASSDFADSSKFSNWDFDFTWENAILSHIDNTTKRPYLRYQTNEHRLELKVTPTSGGSTNLSHSYFDNGDSLKLIATPSQGYNFIGWTYENGSAYNANSTIDTVFDFSDDRILVANFAENHNWDCGSGTLLSPYCIESIEDLTILSKAPYLWDKHFYLANDIDASSTKISNFGKGFLPIAYGGDFSGSLDGRGHKISNLNIHRTSSTDINVGLFSTIRKGVVKNLILENANIEGYSYVGSIAGRIFGIAGTLSVYDCHTTGQLNGNYSHLGGIVGYASTALLSRNSSSMTINNKGSYTGGIVGSLNSSSSITQSQFDGTISSMDRTGAIAGYIYYKSSVDSCYSNATVTGRDMVSGMVGYSDNNSTVLHCDFTGVVNGRDHIGGIVGYQYRTNSTTSLNHFGGIVTGVNNVGGIVGYNISTSNVINCYSTGAINGAGNSTGGIVGCNTGSSISKCYTRGLIRNNSTAALVGVNEMNSSITNCYSDKDITLQTKLINVNNDTDPSHIQNNSSLNSTEFSGGKSYFPYLNFGTTDDAPWKIDSAAKLNILKTNTFSSFKVETAENTSGQMTYSTPYLGNQEVIVSNDIPKKATGTNLDGDIYEFSNMSVFDKRTDTTAPLETGVRKLNPLTSEWEYFAKQNTIEATTDTVIWQYYAKDTQTERIYTGNAIILAIKYSGGSGTQNDPYQIEDAFDLITLSNTRADWSKNFYQVDDVLFTVPSEFGSTQQFCNDADNNGTISFDEIDFNGDGDFTNDALGFSPIGDFSKKFSGNYKGRNIGTGTDQSYLIDHLYINRTSTDSVGLFGATSSNTAISFIEFTNSNVSGKYYVGICCGAGPSSLSRIQTGGTVIGRKRVGGVIGSLEEGYGSIKECGNSATVINNGTVADNNEGQHTGGVAGYIKRTIKNSYNTGYIYSSRTTGGNTGGITGTVTSSMSNCYSSGAVNGRANVGGITGQNQGTITQLSASGYVFGVNNTNTGAISGANKANLTNAVYDTTIVKQNSTTGLNYAATSIQLNTSDYNKQTSFPFSFGNSAAEPWKINSNTYGRPYFYWQDDASISNPFPRYTTLGFDADATYTGTLQTPNPATPEITNKGVRITKVNSNGEASWNNIAWEWYHIYTNNISSTTFTTIQNNIFDEDDEFMVQPFVINTNGQMRYGDMVKMKAHYLLTVITHNDSERDTTSTTLNGEVIIGSNITEYGVLYSKDATTMTLDDLSANSAIIVKKASETTSTDIDASELSPFRFSLPLAVGDLVNRSGYYTRAYAKDESGATAYGNIKRFITEKRDFSLHLDGTSALLTDATSTSNYISDWSSSGTNQFSIDFWIKDESGLSAEQTILDNHSSTSGYTVSLGTDGKIHLKSHNGNRVSTTSSITDDLWHYVAITYNGANSAAATLYLDNTAASQSILLVKPASLNKLCIGAQINGTTLSNAFTGKLDALRFWNTPLSNDQIHKLAYDNVQASANNKIELKGSGLQITDLAWENLTAAIGFNVKSTLETETNNIPTSYENEDEGHDYPFFCEEGHQQFNLITIGSAHPSPYLPRTNWSFVATTNQWLTGSNWSSYTYPGEGISSTELDLYRDVTPLAIKDSGDYCQYTIINKIDVANFSKPIISIHPPYIHYLIDNDRDNDSYRVNGNSTIKLVIKDGVLPQLFPIRAGLFSNGSGYLEIESGSIEVE